MGVKPGVPQHQGVRASSIPHFSSPPVQTTARGEFESHVLESLRRLTVHKGQCGPYHGVPSVVGCKVDTAELLVLDVNCSLSMYKTELSNRDKTLRFMPNLER
jgi:hypothetical protein